MIFEDFVNTIRAINKTVYDEDVRGIESHIGFIEKRLKKSLVKTMKSCIP